MNYCKIPGKCPGCGLHTYCETVFPDATTLIVKVTLIGFAVGLGTGLLAYWLVLELAR